MPGMGENAPAPKDRSGGPIGSVPENAPSSCPGVESEAAGKTDSCVGCPNQDVCASGEAAAAGPDPDIAAIAARLGAPVKHKILVLRYVTRKMCCLPEYTRHVGNLTDD
jgi:hypothetical protein